MVWENYVASLGGGVTCGITCRILIVILPLIATPCISQVLNTRKLKVCSCVFSVMACFKLFNVLKVTGRNGEDVTLAGTSQRGISRAFVGVCIVRLFAAFITLVTCLLFMAFLFSKGGVITCVRAVVLLSCILSVA